MPNVALIRDGLVYNVVGKADDPDFDYMGAPLIVELDKGSPVGPGFRYEDGEFIAPEPIAEKPVKRLVSKSLWLEQLYLNETVKLAELVARSAAIDWSVPPTDTPTTLIRYFAAFLVQFDRLGDYIDLNNQKVLEGIEIFRQLAGMSVERMFELLDYTGNE